MWLSLSLSVCWRLVSLVVISVGTLKEAKRREKRRQAKTKKNFSRCLSLSLLLNPFTSRRKRPCRHRASSTTRSPCLGSCRGPEPGRSQRARRRFGALPVRRWREQRRQVPSPPRRESSSSSSSPLRRRRGMRARSQRSAESDDLASSRESERPRLF